MKLEHLFSKIKNSNKRFIDVSNIRLMSGVLDVLYREGRIRYYHKYSERTLRVFLKSSSSSAFGRKERDHLLLPEVLKRRPFAATHKLIPHHIMTTSSREAVCTGKEARKAKVGGTILGKL